MDKNINLTIEEIFNNAVKNHQENKIEVALNLYEKILKINPLYAPAHNNLGTIFKELGENQKAKSSFKKAIEISPNFADAYNNLGIIFKELGENQKAKNSFEKAIEINPNYINAYYNLGIVFKELRDNQKAKDCYEKTIELNPNYAAAHNNLGVVFKELGENQKAKNYYKKAIDINPNYAGAHNNLGLILKRLGQYHKAKTSFEKAIKINPSHAGFYNNLGNTFADLAEDQKAKSCFEKAIEIDPNYTETYWNLQILASDVDDALTTLNKLYKIDSGNIKSKITISALEGYKGDLTMFNELLTSSSSNHSYTRSAKWFFSLPKLPKIFFNRWSFFDALITLTDNSRPFYEFGVWNGFSFKYLINTFKKGFGFDTFTGLPEAWHNEPLGTYSSFGVVPKIEGGEFIVGKFKDTLPEFFSQKRPMASLINFDADLYSSTLCALNYSNKVIDEKTILIFDEMIMNDNWEEDEFKALNEFCNNLGYSYDVIAVSFFTKQVAVKLKK